MEPCLTEQNTEKENSRMPVFDFLSRLDIDMSLILPLILFLGKEGADELLILALIYIMS